MDACQCLCKILSGSIRLILFVGAIILILVEIVHLIGLRSTAEYAKEFGEEAGYQHYVFAITLILVGLLGCHGAYYGHVCSIRTFAAAITISLVALLSYLYLHSNTEALKERNDRIFGSLRDSMQAYDWTHKSSSEQKLVATSKWDLIQSATCCGIEGKQDWDSYRPLGLVSKEYPPSCCQTGQPLHEGYARGLCKETDSYNKGCLARVEQLETIEVKAICFMAAFLILLLAISLFCLCQCCFPADTALQNIRARGFTLTLPR